MIKARIVKSNGISEAFGCQCCKSAQLLLICPEFYPPFSFENLSSKTVLFIICVFHPENKCFSVFVLGFFSYYKKDQWQQPDTHEQSYYSKLLFTPNAGKQFGKEIDLSFKLPEDYY